MLRRGEGGIYIVTGRDGEGEGERWGREREREKGREEE